MPENPVNPQTPKPLDPISPWIRDMVKDKPVAKPLVEEAPKLGVPPVVEEVKPVVPIVEAPVVTEPVVPAVAPVVTAPVLTTAPSSPLK